MVVENLSICEHSANGTEFQLTHVRSTAFRLESEDWRSERSQRSSSQMPTCCGTLDTHRQPGRRGQGEVGQGRDARGGETCGCAGWCDDQVPGHFG